MSEAPEAEADVKGSPSDDEVEIEELTKEDAGSDDERPKKEKSKADTELDKIEEEKKNMTPVEKLERSLLEKAQGNDFFKKGDILKAADCYYHSIVYCRDITKNPKYYPELKHTEEQQKTAKDLCESVFTNLALVQLKYGNAMDSSADINERRKVFSEAAKSSTEALKLNEKNVKALFRRASANAILAHLADNNEEAQKLCLEAKDDLVKVIEAEPQNREARSELKQVQEHYKELKREEREGEKREFSFASTLAAFGTKEKDLLGDGSVMKQVISAGDGGIWLNEDWLNWSSATKCVVHVTIAQTDKGKPKTPVKLSFILGDPEMHVGVNEAVKSMTQGEVSSFTFAAHRLAARSSLVKLLPDVQEPTSVWEITFLKFVTWEDLGRDGERLQKIHSEGYGSKPEELAEIFTHWRVFGPDETLIHSTRFTINLNGPGGLRNEEDEDKPAVSYILGENAWEPLAVLCRSLRQGGVGELRLRELPEIPKQDASGEQNVAAQLSLMMSKAKKGQEETLRHCVVRLELERVVLPVAGPGDARWEGVNAIIKEHFHALELLERGEDNAALVRLQRVQRWIEQEPDAKGLSSELASARASIGWILTCRAAPILDSGSVNSAVLAVARKDLAEAEEHCTWLEEHCLHFDGTHCLRAKILIAQDDDFEGAHAQLIEAQRLSPNNKRVQEELKRVKIELRKVEEVASKKKVAMIRDSLKRARDETGSEREEAVLNLLRELSETRCSWETVMETRIGVELKHCQETCGEEAKRMCREILGRLKDESKEQRPMWES